MHASKIRARRSLAAMDQRQRRSLDSESGSVCGKSSIEPGMGRVSKGIGSNVKKTPTRIENARYHAYRASGKSNVSSTARIIRGKEKK
jgi:hypothetical protein